METVLQLNLYAFSPFHSSKHQNQNQNQNLLSSQKTSSSISLKIQTFSGSSSVTHVSRRLSTIRVAPSIKTEAQCALMDYLHSTQGYTFIDAEFISNNSPRFIQSLLSKINDKSDVSRSLKKFLSIGMGQDDIAHILSSYMHLLSKHSLKGRKTVCKELGVGKADLCQIVKDDPLKLISLASRPDQKSAENVFHGDPHNNYLEKTAFLQKLGYSENTEEMEKASKIFRGRGDQLQERFDCLVEAGLDYNTVIEMIKRVPMILNQKRSLIQKKIDFVKDILGYPVECLVGYPTYFCHDLDKISARCSMYAWLKEMNAVNPELTLSTVVSANNKRFVKYFVNMHPQGPTMWKSLKKSSNKKVLD